MWYEDSLQSYSRDNRVSIMHLCGPRAVSVSADRRSRVVTSHHGSQLTWPGTLSVYTYVAPSPFPPLTNNATLCLYHTNRVTFTLPSRGNILILRTEQLMRAQYGCLHSYWLRACLCRPIGRGDGCKIKRATDSTSEKLIWNRRRSDWWLTMLYLILITETQVQLKSDIKSSINTFLKIAHPQNVWRILIKNKQDHELYSNCCEIE